MLLLDLGKKLMDYTVNVAFQCCKLVVFHKLPNFLEKIKVLFGTAPELIFITMGSGEKLVDKRKGIASTKVLFGNWQNFPTNRTDSIINSKTLEITKPGV